LRSVIGVLGEAAQGKIDLKDPAQLDRLKTSFGETIERYQWITGKDAGDLKVLFEKSMADGTLAPEEQAALQEAVSSSPAFAETVERMQGQAGQSGGVGGFLGQVQGGASQAFDMAQQHWGQMPTWAKFAAGLGLPMAAIGLMSTVFGGGGVMGLLASVLGIGGMAAGLGAFGGTQGPLSGMMPQLEGIVPWLGQQFGFGSTEQPEAAAPEQAQPAPDQSAPAQAQPAPVPAPAAQGQPAQPAQAQAAPQGGAPPIQDLAAWTAMPGQAKIDYVKKLPKEQAIGFVQSVLSTHGVGGARQMLANIPINERQKLKTKFEWYASLNGKEPWIDQAIQALS
jgi:pyruvate/2-oxoglutarate dehydrogenase complex dihydrolipoamide acyltransferase (E2) component